MGALQKYQKKYIKELNGNFFTKSKEKFPVEQKKVMEIISSNIKEMNLYLLEISGKKYLSDRLLDEIKSKQKFVNNQLLEIISQEPEFENITVNSYYKLAAGV
jgi:hypothetical protein